MEQEEYYARVEEALSLAKIDPVQSRSEAEGQWNLRSDQLEIWIDVLPIEQNNRTYLQVMTPLVQIPDENREVFLAELLEYNYQMIDASFCIFEGGTYLKIMREIENLSPDEILLAFNRIGYYGSTHLKGLVEKFKAKKIEFKEE